MIFFRLFKNKQIGTERLMHDEVLISSLDKKVDSNKQYVDNVKLDINKNDLHLTLTQLITLLSRKREKNPLHMHMIMYLSEELNKFSLNNSFSDETKRIQFKYTFINSYILLEIIYEIMELAEKITFNNKKIEDKYIFKDERQLLRTFLYQ